MEKTVAKFGVDPTRPILLQVSRFDRAKDPLGVIEAYRLAKRHIRDLQLVYLGGPAHDDPEGEEVYNEAVAAAGATEIYTSSYSPRQPRRGKRLPEGGHCSYAKVY